MRLAILHAQSAFVRGGAETHTEALLSALQREGHEAEIETSVRIFATDDLLEGARSFVEKRPPEYHGR